MKSWLLILIPFAFAFAFAAQAQSRVSTCETNRSAPPTGPYYWAPDAEVKVYFQSGMFTAEQQEALQAAMNSWSRAKASNESGVTFKFAGETDGTTSCGNCLIVVRENIRKSHRNYLAYFFPFNLTNDGQLSKAWIVVDERTTRSDVLQTFMGHELGHGMGLWDCPRCKKKATLMRSFPSVNKVDRVVEPSACDMEVVRKFYQSRRQVAVK